MRTPAGKECSYFYGDYHRGRNRQECRLLDAAPGPGRWTADLCKTCPVPDIQAANACPNLTLEGQVGRRFIILGRMVNVRAYCTKTLQPVAEPHVGCGQCHPLPPIFSQPDQKP
jgi:hypothetical protein